MTAPDSQDQSGDPCTSGTVHIPTAPDPNPTCPECGTPGSYFKGSEYDCDDDSCDVVTFDQDEDVTYPGDWGGLLTDESDRRARSADTETQQSGWSE